MSNFLKIIFILFSLYGRNWVQAETPTPSVKIRQPAVAGSFYPANPEKLNAKVNQLLSEAKSFTIPGIVRALIVPHAGYPYSGSVAATAYKALNKQYSRIILIGSNHINGVPPFKFSVAKEEYYEIPGGKIKVAPIATPDVAGLVQYVPMANSSHVIEVQLPFLQKLQPSASITPIITGDVSNTDIEKMASTISNVIDDETLLVASTDLSHYHPYEEAQKLDHACIGAIQSMDDSQINKCEACSLPAVKILVQVAKKKGWLPHILDYRNSGDTSEEKGQVVGYSAIAFTDKAPDTTTQINEEDRKSLLKLSRQTLEEYLQNKSVKTIDEDKLSKALRESSGCFVTLKINNELRGCIGNLDANRKLYQCVIENSINAAVHDPRFPPVNTNELDKISIEVSVLTSPRQITPSSPKELLSTLIPLKHGIILKNGFRQATFLPQVWEQLPDKEEFLSHLCRKGGMPPLCWKDPNTQVFLYNDMAFSENP